MQQTSHYQLSQWDAADRIQMADFNSDNQKIEAALTEQAAELDTKASHTELAAAIPWVKIGEATLTAAAQKVSVSIPNAEQYACFFLVFDVSGTSEVGIRWTGMSSYENITNQGWNQMTRCGGFIHAVPLPGGGVFARDLFCAITADSSKLPDVSNLLTKAVTSGSVNVEIWGRNDNGENIEFLKSGSALVVYGLKK